MEKTYKRVPFDIELAKKIQSGEVDGRIVTIEGKKLLLIEHYIELPEETPIQMQINIEQLEELKEYVGQLMKVNQSVINNLEDMVKDLKRSCELEKTPKHEFKSFDKVLVRNSDDAEWHVDFFSHYNRKDGHIRCATHYWNECIPYNEETAHLVGTTDSYENN